MLFRGRDQTIDIVYEAAVRSMVQMAPYAASKHALLGMGRSVARALTTLPQVRHVQRLPGAGNGRLGTRP